MATYYFRNATATWGTASNWSLSSGGPANGAIPGNGDDVIFDSNSRSSCTLNSNRNSRNLSFTNWTGTFDMSGVLLRINGSLDYGDALFTITNAGSWEMGGTTGVLNGQTITTNGKTISGILSFGYTSGTNPVRLVDDVTCGLLQIQSNIGSPSQPIFTGQTLYTSSISTASNGRNLYTTTPIKMIGTGYIQTFNSNAALGCDIEIMASANTVTLSSTVSCTTNFKLKYSSGTIAPTGILYVQANSQLDLSGMTLPALYIANSPTITLVSSLTTNTISLVAGATFTTNGFTTGSLNMGTGTLTLPVGVNFTVTNSMNSLVSTLAVKALIRSSTPGVQATFNLQNGATQDNGYLSATDIDSSGGRSIWTYKGILSNTINWNKMSTNPKKHVLNYKNRILK
ncbi:hypothetical protein KBD45_04915 [Candidatus Dojkabacteria bacterium]|nr:hypothetical protein [Candidatus Dojkabacteria bacterium]